MQKSHYLHAFGCLLGSCLITLAHGTPALFQPTTVAQVNLQRYLGQWYEIARLPMFFQRKCASHVTATYRMNPDGTVAVNNRCRKTDGSVVQAIGQATVANTSASQLKVTFLPKPLRWLPFGTADYWILGLEENYQSALVGTPDRKYLWILSRTPTLLSSTYQSYIDQAKQQGYRVDQLIQTIQTTR